MLLYEKIVSILEQTHRIDSKCELFGASKHRYRLNPPIKEAVVREVEAKYNFQLPEDYLQFITGIANGISGSSCQASEGDRCLIRTMKGLMPLRTTVSVHSIRSGLIGFRTQRTFKGSWQSGGNEVSPRYNENDMSGAVALRKTIQDIVSHELYTVYVLLGATAP